MFRIILQILRVHHVQGVFNLNIVYHFFVRSFIHSFLKHLSLTKQIPLNTDNEQKETKQNKTNHLTNDRYSTLPFHQASDLKGVSPCRRLQPRGSSSLVEGRGGRAINKNKKKIPKLRKTPQNSLKLQAFLTVGKGYRTPKDANSNQYT
jgi:hypothetical protein